MNIRFLSRFFGGGSGDFSTNLPRSKARESKNGSGAFAGSVFRTRRQG
jgi:hypothetical protein